MDLKEATANIAALLAEVDLKLEEASKVADGNGINFTYHAPDGTLLHYTAATKNGNWDNGWESSNC